MAYADGDTAQSPSFSAFENFSEVPLLWGILEPCPAGDPKLGKALCWASLGRPYLEGTPGTVWGSGM